MLSVSSSSRGPFIRTSSISTCLVLHCRRRYAGEVVSLLLELGANPGVVDQDGCNALHLACAHGTANLVLALDEKLHSEEMWCALDNERHMPADAALLNDNTEVLRVMVEQRRLEPVLPPLLLRLQKPQNATQDPSTQNGDTEPR